ncbi:hypothetical protein RJP21_04505 [Paenibacillus sp. VCA1]|uniref:hypothetical protein n=1 Tax=Paenibacillus sp. VCA1 TaxID=3039148 RepID=UPI002870D740|nr:hypothetical protein [Paenibacillus sp. VCA1]MDR9852864.1 hypothetical protein [Paenibacillus sp. VCA1]
MEYLIHSLGQEEKNVCEKIEDYKGVQTEHDDRDENTMKYYEEVNGVYEDWKGYLEETKAMIDVWKVQLEMNPVNPPDDTKPASEPKVQE